MRDVQHCLLYVPYKFFFLRSQRSDLWVAIDAFKFGHPHLLQRLRTVVLFSIALSLKAALAELLLVTAVHLSELDALWATVDQN